MSVIYPFTFIVFALFQLIYVIKSFISYNDIHLKEKYDETVTPFAEMLFDSW